MQYIDVSYWEEEFVEDLLEHHYRFCFLIISLTFLPFKNEKKKSSTITFFHYYGIASFPIFSKILNFKF